MKKIIQKSYAVLKLSVICMIHLFGILIVFFITLIIKEGRDFL